MGRVIVVTSGKGGVGKTTITANLGIMLALGGRSVCVVDADIGLNNLDVVLGVENRIVYDLVDCMEGKCRAIQALLQDDMLQGLYVLPCCKIYDGRHIDVENFCRIIKSLQSSFDFVLIDSPAGIGEGFFMASAPAEEAVIVVNPHISSIRDASKTIALLEKQKINNVSVVINRVQAFKVKKREMLSVDEIEVLLSKRSIGIIPESEELWHYNSFLARSEPFKDSSIKYAFAFLSKNLVCNRFDKYNYLSKNGRFAKILKKGW